MGLERRTGDIGYHSASAMKKKIPSPVKAEPSDSELGFVDWVAKYRGERTLAELASAAEVPASTLSMILNKKKSRRVSVRIAVKLASALCPGTRDLRDFTVELLAKAGYREPERFLEPESVAERVRRGRATIRAAYVVSEPFVRTRGEGQLKPAGFAIELFDYVAAMLGVSVRYDPIELKDLPTAFERHDIVVSAILGSFRRSRFVTLSRRFPYVRIPLSAVVRRDVKSVDLNVRKVLRWELLSQDDSRLEDVRFLLVESEVGDDFVTTFLGRQRSPKVIRTSSLEPAKLAKLLTSKADILIADMATCEAVCDEDDSLRPLEEDPSDSTSALFEHSLSERKFNVLALYDVGYGLPPNDPEWQELVNRALDSLLLEGLRPLLYLYTRYMKSEVFRAYCTSLDAEPVPERVRMAFAKLFETSGSTSGNQL